MTSLEASDIIIEKLELSSDPIIAIDGRSCAGKTTLSSLLSERLGAAVVHMDDFFLPAALRTPERLRSPGGNVHYERFKSEVLPFLGKISFSYGVFDCSAMAITRETPVPAGAVIVEGAYSLSPRFGKYWDLSVFMDIEPMAQRARLLSRSPEAVSDFENLWIPMEEKYFSFFDIRRAADLVLI